MRVHECVRGCMYMNMLVCVPTHMSMDMYFVHTCMYLNCMTVLMKCINQSACMVCNLPSAVFGGYNQDIELSEQGCTVWTTIT